MVNVVLKNAKQCAPADRAYTSQIQNKKKLRKGAIIFAAQRNETKASAGARYCS